MIRPADDRRTSPIEKMLDQYGLAYICLNPLVLFGEGPAGNEPPTHPAHGGGPLTANRARVCERGQSERLSWRVTEAYDILNRLYAPWPADYDRPQYPSYEHAGYRP